MRQLAIEWAYTSDILREAAEKPVTAFNRDWVSISFASITMTTSITITINLNISHNCVCSFNAELNALLDDYDYGYIYGYEAKMWAVPSPKDKRCWKIISSVLLLCISYYVSLIMYFLALRTVCKVIPVMMLTFLCWQTIHYQWYARTTCIPYMLYKWYRMGMSTR